MSEVETHPTGLFDELELHPETVGAHRRAPIKSTGLLRSLHYKTRNPGSLAGEAHSPLQRTNNNFYC
ncbi:MAG: hypothetical protein ACOC07_03150 [Coleofasciculus sp.]|uniref:hypothetical protein n=1 Tax=Coleofasciculus sp. TaxID=3100458 RepID=UPI003A2C26F1